MIKAIFFSKFDVHEGPKVIHQVPADSIVPSASSTHQPLIHFPSLSSYIIPRQAFCSHLITITTPTYRLLSHPICLSSPRYPRNELIFSFTLVLSSSTPFSTYTPVTNKLSSLLAHLESTTSLLSSSSPQDATRIYALCEILLEDLNNYSETMIPISPSDTLNIKLFPVYPPPPPVLPHYVPLSLVRLSSLTDPNWDLTMQRILPFINGVHSVAHIALLADADLSLVRAAIAHLLYYGCLLLLDIFSFGACYAPTAEMSSFVADTETQEECARYVARLESGLPGETERRIEGAELVGLYCSFRQGQTLRGWCIEHAEVVIALDVRRLVSFGVVKGFLYRVHRYAVAVGKGEEEEQEDWREDREENTVEKISGVEGEASRGWERNHRKKGGSASLDRFLDGTHSFDEICTALGISERELVARLKSRGDVHIIQR